MRGGIVSWSSQVSIAHTVCDTMTISEIILEMGLLEGVLTLNLFSNAQQHKKEILVGNKPSSGATTNLSIYQTSRK